VGHQLVSSITAQHLRATNLRCSANHAALMPHPELARMILQSSTITR